MMSQLPARVTPAPVLHGLMIASGAAGLGYQISWTRMFSAGLGHEVPGMLAVVSAFFVGLALGAFTLDRAVGRAARPGRWYAGLELAIGLWAVVSVALIPWVNEFAYALIGTDASPARHWLVAFALPAITLLPATTAMGATLPAIDRIATAQTGSDRRHVGGLYASNTLGAVIGTLASAFFMLPAFGYTVTTLAFASVNLLVALFSFALWRSVRAPEEAVDVESERRLPRARLAATLFFTGLLGIGYEVLAVRVMAQILENTVYSFAAGLSAFLVGTALGGAIYQRFMSARVSALLVHYLLVLLSATVLIGVLTLARSAEIYEQFRQSYGANALGSVLAEITLACLVFLPATVAMGMMFAHLAQTSRRERSGVGFAVGINTIGSSLASLLFVVVLLPAFGARDTLIALAFAYLLLLPSLKLRMLPALSLPLVLGAIGLTVDLSLVEPPPGGRTLWKAEGVLGTVAVVENQNGERFLKLNNKFNMGGVQKTPDGRLTAFAEPRQAHLPLLFHGSPERALFLGVGTGATIGATREWTDVQATGVELVPEVVESTRFFEEVVGDWRDDGSISILTADARRFVRADDGAYDVIVADLFHPARDGAGTLYTIEHFRSIDDRLDDGGIFCQWLPLYQLDAESLRLITRTFLQVYPHAFAILSPFNTTTPMLGLVGSRTPRQYSFGWAREVVTETPLAATLIQLQTREDLDLFGSVLATDEMLREFAGDGPVNTDDHPIVVYEAPRHAYSDARTSWGTLVEMIDTFDSVDVTPFLDIDRDDITSQANALRLEKYRRARDVYLRALVMLSTGDEPAGLEQLIESLELSSDFTAARQTLRQVAPNVMRSNPTLGMRIREVLSRRGTPLPSRMLPDLTPE